MPREQKKPYSSPKLIEYGDLYNVTAGDGAGSFNDWRYGMYTG